MALIRVISPIVEAALIVAPELLEVPVLGRVLSGLQGGQPLTEHRALEELARLSEEEKKTRQKEIDDNSRYVIKVSEALKCVQSTTLRPSAILTLARGLIKALSGGTGEGLMSVMYGDISRCIIENALRQDTPRVFSTKGQYHRPARGHGKGRTSFG